ncbi:peroxisomal membrane protein PEX16 [Prorops nasuta]|uniref:peroxisomal membrane protein PEX16 n=1 Tax=Prorops nasuta TaxID=863751 RepID=UPI0034CFE2D1
MALNAVNNTISTFVDSYKKWITTNPQLVVDIESTVRCLSYLTAGRFSSSSFYSEFIYSMPNLLVLLNDLMLYSSKYAHLKLPQFESKIKIWLTVLEYTEALYEISAKKLWGDNGKWIIICILQIMKTILRLFLVHVYEERLTKTPPITPLNREKLNSENCNNIVNTIDGYVLKRSGSMIRSIKATDSIQVRTWAPLLNKNNESNNNINKVSKRKLIFAETLYIIKPLVHLACISTKGQKHWQPWLVAFALDIISLELFTKEAKYTQYSKEEKAEIFHRKVSLLLYLVRSPFYDRYSRIRINKLLEYFSANVPLARFLAEPMAKYLPHWQSIYFYMWSC